MAHYKEKWYFFVFYTEGVRKEPILRGLNIGLFSYGVV